MDSLILLNCSVYIFERSHVWWKEGNFINMVKQILIREFFGVSLKHTSMDGPLCRKIPYLMLHMSLLSYQPPECVVLLCTVSNLVQFTHIYMNIWHIRKILITYVLVDDANILYRTQWKKVSKLWKLLQ